MEERGNIYPLLGSCSRSIAFGRGHFASSGELRCPIVCLHSGWRQNRDEKYDQKSYRYTKLDLMVTACYLHIPLDLDNRHTLSNHDHSFMVRITTRNSMCYEARGNTEKSIETSKSAVLFRGVDQTRRGN